MFFLYLTIGLSNVMLLLASLWNLKYHFDFSIPSRNLRYFLLFLLGIEVISKLLIYVFHAEKMEFLFSIFVAGELLFLINFTNSIVSKKNRISVFYIGLLLFSMGSALIHTFFQEVSWVIWIKPISNIIIVFELGRCLLFALKSGFKGTNPGLFNVLFALLFYYFVSTILFLVLHQLSTIGIEKAAFLWSINNLLSISLYAVCLYYFYSFRKSTWKFMS